MLILTTLHRNIEISLKKWTLWLSWLPGTWMSLAMLLLHVDISFPWKTGRKGLGGVGESMVGAWASWTVRP